MSLDRLPDFYPEPILCSYSNTTPQLQIVRICDVENWYFERVVFPAQQLLFTAPRHAHLEVHTGSMSSAILSDRIPCDQLDTDPNRYMSELKQKQRDPVQPEKLGDRLT
jgi:hypothetical protein